MVYNWVKTLLLRAFPPSCMLCGQAADGALDLCAACRASLPWLGQACYLCAQPLHDSGDYDDPDPREHLICGRCIRKPPRFDRSYCALIYQEPINWLVQRLKYHGQLAGIPILSELLRESLQQRVYEWPQLIIPVPMHARRLRVRGFNQALEIARPLSKAFGIVLADNICERQRDTPAQIELPAEQRAANVRNAFHMRGDLPAKHVAIVDDVVTTGATVNELARLLKQRGAESVQVWAVARTPGLKQ
jgi:ComF family protein